MLQWALKYRNLGMSVIPLVSKGKEPLIKWEEFQSRIASEEEIKSWFVKTPTANIGIVTGTVSGIVVVDLDGPEGLQNAVKLSLSSPYCITTGRGKHLWFRYAQGLVNSASKLAEGIDVRGEGGYVVAPPSVHPNGQRYRWIKPLINTKDLPIFPLDIGALNLKNVAPFVSNNEDNWITDALEDMKNGHVYNTLVSVLGKFRYNNFSISDTVALLKPYAFENGQPYEGLEDKVREIWGRYEPRSQFQSITNVNTSGAFASRDSGLTIHSPLRSKSWEEFNSKQEMDKENGQTGIKTGFSKLDAFLQNGLKSSRLFTIAARTGVGKTNFIIGIARNLCLSDKTVLLFSTEMPYTQIWQRYLATLNNRSEFNQHKFYVCDSFAPNLERVEEAINQIKPDLFIFDHINHVSEEVKGLGEFMQGLNQLRRKYDCAGIVTAQLNRAADWVDLKTGEKVTPRMSMIKGSGTIEQASSRVLLLNETRVTPECTEIVGNLDKNDDGAKGLLNFGLYQNPWRIEEL